MKTAESKQLSSPKLEFLYKVYMQLSIISWFKSYWDSIILTDITAINSLLVSLITIGTQLWFEPVVSLAITVYIPINNYNSLWWWHYLTVTSYLACYQI